MKWIKTEDRLPDVEMKNVSYNVIGFNDEYGHYAIAYYEYDECTWYDFSDNTGLEITHWMPLPAKPKKTIDKFLALGEKVDRIKNLHNFIYLLKNDGKYGKCTPDLIKGLSNAIEKEIQLLEESLTELIEKKD